MNNSRITLIVGLGLVVLVGLVIFAGAGKYAHYTEVSQVPVTQDVSSESSTAIEQDLAVKAILLKGSDGRYPDFTVPVGAVADASTFTFAGYSMKTVGRFYKDSQYLYWVVFPVPLYDLPFSITRVPNGDPATFHAIRVGSFDADAFAADKNQFYCGPFPFVEINPSDAKVVVEDGYAVVQANGKTYERTALDFGDLAKGAKRPCAEIGPKGPGTAN